MTEHNLARSKWALAAIALLAALAAAVVSAGPDPASAGGAACDPARTHDAGDFSKTIDSGGLTREYILHIPPSYTGAEAVPLVFGFHGIGSSAERLADRTQLPTKADEAGFLLVMPQGRSTELVEAVHWNIVLFGEPEANDVAFIDELLDALEAQLCVDAARVYSTGMSMGAQMSSRLACSLSERIAAVAPVSGVYFPPLTPEIPEPPGCPSTRPVPLIASHGSADTTVPFDGGPGGVEGATVTFRLSIEDAISEWAQHNACDGTPAEEQVTEHVRRLRYQGCRQGATVELYIIEGGEHVWPGADDQEEPDVTDEINATDLLWDFFVAHPMLTTPPQPTAIVAAPTSGSGPGTGDNAGVPEGVIAVLAGLIALGGGAVYAGSRLRS